jgi:hypothetical protein
MVLCKSSCLSGAAQASPPFGKFLGRQWAFGAASSIYSHSPGEQHHYSQGECDAAAIEFMH